MFSTKPVPPRLGTALRSGTAQARSVAALTSAQRGALARLENAVGGPVRLRLHPLVGTPRFIDLARPLSNRGHKALSSAAVPVSARAFLRDYANLFLLSDPDAELSLDSQRMDELGYTHFRFSQRFDNLPVWPAELQVHLAPGGAVDSLDGTSVPSPTSVPLTPTVTATEAAAAARVRVGAPAAEVTTPVLIIYAPLERAPRLAWRMEVNAAAHARWLIVIDALTGAELTAYSLVMDGGVAGSGVDLLDVTRSIHVWQQTDTYYLVDTSKSMFDASSSPPGKPSGAISVLDARHQTLPESGNMTVYQVTSPSATSGWLADGVSALFGLSETYDYYRARHGRDSIDAKGGGMFAVVRYGENYRNAFWNGQGMFFGDAVPYAAAEDIVAHELTHGVTSYSANLIYQDQSGAMNEAFSDVFGVMVEAWTRGTNNWVMGDNLGQSGRRTLANPGSVDIIPGRPYPSRMSEFVGPNDPLLDKFENKDQGGVHVNCTIIGHAFYMLCAGLPEPLVPTNAAAIFYRALTTHLVAQSQFADCRLACIKSAEEIFGIDSVQAQRTGDAFDAVELFDAAPAPPPPPNPVVTGPDSAVFVYYDPVYWNYYLARREDALADPSHGTVLSASSAVVRRPSVSGDGAFAVFVTGMNDMSFVATDGSSDEQVLGYPMQIHSVAMAPDGQHYGFVMQDMLGNPSDVIQYFDLTGDGKARTINLVAPSDAGPVNAIYYADTMFLTADNRYVIYDALNSIQVSGGGASEVWSIYAYDLETGRTLCLVPPVPGRDIGNPHISHRNNLLMTFEVYDPVTSSVTVYTADLATGTNQAVATVQGILAWPCFNGDDTSLCYNQVDPNNATGSSLYVQPLAPDHVTPLGPPAEWVDDGCASFVYRRGTYTGPAAPTQADLVLSVAGAPDPVPLGSNITFTVTVRNAGPDAASSVTVVDTLPANAVFVTGTLSQGDGSHDSGKVTCHFGSLAASATATAAIVVQATGLGPARDAASVVAEQEDVHPADNNAAASVTVVASAATALLTVQANPSEGGTVSGGGTYPVGSSQQIAATANSGWSFVSWQDDVTTNPRTVTIPPGGATFTARLQQSGDCGLVTFQVPEVPAAGASGHICSVNPDATLDRVTNRVTFPEWVTAAVVHRSGGSTIQLSPGVTLSFPPEPYTVAFDVSPNSGGPRSAAVLRVTYSACSQDLVLTQAGSSAAMATLSLQASPPEGGTASGSGTYPVGSHCTIQAAANPGWYFGIWQDGVADNPRQVVVPAVGAKFTAYFSNAIPQIVVQPADLAVEVGQPAVFSVTAAQHAGPPYVFYWHKQEKMAAVFSADTESSFVLTNAQVADAGQYYVVISNSLAVSASTNSRVASLQVTNPSAGQLVQFSNSAPILIHDAAPAQPYPSIITIAGQQGPIQSATVSLNALAHVWPHDIGVLLVGPQGQEVVLMANAGGGQVLTGVTLTFDDAAATVLSEESPILAGCYRPSACGASEVFPSPAPAGPYAAALTTLNGADPNGNWSLYVHDDQPGDSGQIAQGWTLSLGLKSSAPDSRPVVRQPRLDVDGHFTFELAGASGTNYEVRVSSDLKNWKVLSTISLVGSKTNVVDPNPPLQQRYYRVRRVPE